MYRTKAAYDLRTGRTTYSPAVAREVSRDLDHHVRRMMSSTARYWAARRRAGRGTLRALLLTVRARDGRTMH